jgi:hypothetical protein
VSGKGWVGEGVEILREGKRRKGEWEERGVVREIVKAETGRLNR